ncbi:MAG: DNA repair protein RecO, partial [Bradyrhizobium icense]
YPGRNLYTIAQADTVDYFGARIIEDYDRYTAACAALESAERLAAADAPGDPYIYEACVDVLDKLQHGDPLVLLDAFLLKAMSHAGWAPSLFDCAQCQRPGPHHAFHPAVGGAACHQCRPPGAAEVDPETLHHMWLIAHDHPSQPTNAQAQEAHRLTRAHLQWHLERSVGALGIMEQ